MLCIAVAAASLFADDTAQTLALIAPKNGAIVPLLTEKQKAFMRMSREERAAFFDDKQPKKEKEIKRYRSDPLPVMLEWTGASGPFVVSVTKRGATEPWFRETVVSNKVAVWNLEIACGKPSDLAGDDPQTGNVFTHRRIKLYTLL